MAYWQFDLTFTNLGALPEEAHAIAIYGLFSIQGSSNISTGNLVPATGDLVLTANTAEPDYGSPFEVAPETKVWFEVTVMDGTEPPNPPELLAVYLIGPYTVGDIGTEVPAP